MRKPRILFVLTNHGRLGKATDASADKTGFHLAEAAYPWQILTQAGFDVDIASPRGGEAPVDPGSRDLDDAVNRGFLEDEGVQGQLTNTPALATLESGDYDAIYFPGGHGTMWDLPDNEAVQRAVRELYENGKVVAAVCHGPAALVNVKLSDGRWLVEGKKVSVFTDEEEKAVGKDGIVPFLLAKTLVARGARHEKSGNFDASVSVDERLVTGQNPASARGVGEAIRDLVKARAAEAA